MSLSQFGLIALVVFVVIASGVIFLPSLRPNESAHIEGFAGNQTPSQQRPRASGTGGVIGLMTPFGEVRTACASGKNDAGCVDFDRYIPGKLVVGENAYVAGDVRIKGSLAEVVDVNATGSIRARGGVRLRDAIVDGPLSVLNGDMNVRNGFGSFAATFKRGVTAGSLDVGAAGAGVSGRMSADRGFRVGGDVSADGAGWFQLGAGTDKTMLAGGHVLAGKSSVIGGGLSARGGVHARNRVLAGSGEINGASCAVGADLATDSLSLDKNMKIGRNLHVGAYLKSVGGSVTVHGQDGLVTSRGGVSVGGVHPSAGRGVTVARTHGGGVTSFPVRGPSLVDGNLLISGKVCAGEACLSAEDTAMINAYPAIFDDTLASAVAAFNGAVASASNSADKSFDAATARMNALQTNINSNKAVLATAAREDRRIGGMITNIRSAQKANDSEFYAINKHDTRQEDLLKKLEDRLDMLERSTLSVVKDSAIDLKDNVQQCNGCEPEPKWSPIVYVNGAATRTRIN
jgi:hypothetical protein